MMKLHFDSNQPYQLEAIKAVTDIFEGQSLDAGDFSFSLKQQGTLHSEEGFGNLLTLSADEILANIQAIQGRNEIKEISRELDGMNFSVEMETGTGKTYVYLRTIYELNKLYAFKKFLIVVPSVAIREGVMKNLEITKTHFQNLYNRIPVTASVYDSKKVSALRGFASGNAVQILVINIDAFAKDENIINKTNDKLTGKKPIEFIQSTRPIVIVDEPQNMETENRKRAIENLRPLYTLRYSATHTQKYNLVYSLNPVKAYDMGLVKQIEVDAVVSENDFNSAYIQLESVQRSGNAISAKIKLDCNTPSGIKRKSVTISTRKPDLFELSGKNSRYDGLMLDQIDFAEQSIEFSNGLVLQAGESQGGLNDEIMRFMIRRTVEEHLKKERKLRSKGVKVLSLFFIDKVKNYREYDADGNPVPGKYAQWFEEIYKEEAAKPANKGLIQYELMELHNGYFSQDGKGRVKDTGGETQADDKVYELIMQDKEKLLDMNTPLRFIFSHTALREGWDNPNVFQICTLNETKSELKKRQEIGRGLRLCVNQQGQRIFDRAVNRLTVVANESYESFAKALQTEIEDDFGVSFGGRLKDKNTKETVMLRRGFEADPKFLQIWDKIKHHTRYSVNYSTDELIKTAAKAIKDMEATRKPAIRSTKKEIRFTGEGIDGLLISDSGDNSYTMKMEIPDLPGYIQSKTELTRSTILEILKASGRLKEVFLNPQMFMDNAVTAIRRVLYELMVEGIKYEKIGGRLYEMKLFEDNELEIYVNEFTHQVEQPEKTIYENLIPLDSGVESQFAKDCESSGDIEFFFKLPFWFKINTPIGSYNPDWAVVFKGETKIYFVAETKSAGQELRGSESLKIKCGKRHFDEFADVVYKQVSSVSELGKG